LSFRPCAKTTLREDEAIVEFETTDGQAVREHVEHATGSKDNPMSEEQLKAKFIGLTEPVVGAEESRRLINLYLGLPEMTVVDPSSLFSAN